jgi:hypothetical protein
MVLNRHIAHNRVLRHESGRPAVSGEGLAIKRGGASRRMRPIVLQGCCGRSEIEQGGSKCEVFRAVTFDSGQTSNAVDIFVSSQVIRQARGSFDPFHQSVASFDREIWKQRELG